MDCGRGKDAAGLGLRGGLVSGHVVPRSYKHVSERRWRRVGE